MLATIMTNTSCVVNMRLTLVVIVVAMLNSSALLGQNGVSSSKSAEKLGSVSFPISCSSAVRPEFERGVALLHSFQYALAETSFERVATQDPQCAMAYWGEAMGLYHPMFDWPDNETLKKGNEYIEQGMKTGVKTERERDYIRAAAAFYQDNPKLNRNARLSAYSKAMAEVYQRYPQDGEAAAFYALSLLPWYRDDQPQSRMTALKILKDLFAKEPDNPGAAHYLIHAADSPDLAPQGLEAAHRYAEIAPSSAHALHMPAHIFSRLGLWQESVNSNLASAAAAAEATREKHDNESEYQLHAMHYLLYAYLQTGRDIDARNVVEEVKSVPEINDVDVASDEIIMKAIYIMETRRWEDALQMAPSAHTDPFAEMRIYWVRAIAASHRGKPHEARNDVEKLRESFSRFRKTFPSASPNNALVLEGEAWLARAQGKNHKAVEKMHAAVKADEFSVDDESLPAYELLGDLLSDLHQPALALEAYESALKEAPNRFNSLYGAALSAQLEGKEDLAKSYFARLVTVADPGTKRREFQAAKEYLKKSNKHESADSGAKQ